MIVSALFRSASTVFCCQLAEKLNLVFLDEVYDPLNEDILRLKRHNHEFKDVLLDGSFYKLSLNEKIKLWHNHKKYLINNHSYDVPWFEAADLFFVRKDLLGSLESMYQLIVKSKQPPENIWIYADWMRRYVSYIINHLNDRPLIFSETLNFHFRKSANSASDYVKLVFNKKMDPDLLNAFLDLQNKTSTQTQGILKIYTNS